jgi:hypothetical protein
MTNQLTAQQINWAKSHDWFCRMQDGLIVVVDRYSQQHKDGSITHHENTIVWTKSFRALRDWAGY